MKTGYKHFYLKAAALIFALVTVLSLAFTVFADTYPEKFSDNTGIINDTSKQQIEQLLENVSEKYNINVCAAFVFSTNGKRIQAYADDYYDATYPANADGILFLVCSGSRDWAISTSGRGIDIFNGRQLDRIEDNVLDYLRYNEYAEAFEEFAYVCDDILCDRSHIGEEGYSEPFPVWKFILISVCIGLAVGFIVVTIMRSKLKTVYKHTTAGEYVVPGSFNLRVCRDMFLFRTIKKVPKPKSNSSGGSGRHTSSSGSSHGGRSGSF